VGVALAALAIGLSMTAASTDKLFSPQWHEVAHLKPSLSRHVQMRCETIRGQQWYWLICGKGKNTLRFNQPAWEVIGRCDGKTTLDEIWQNAVRLKQDDCATQPETIEIFQQCFEKNLIDTNTNTAWARLETRSTEKQKQEFQGRFSPTGFRIDCGNPSKTIARLKFLGPIVCSPIGALAWLLCVAWIFSILSNSAQPLAAQINAFFTQPASWWLMAAVFVPIKLVHELAHGIVAHHFGAQARQWGVSWMLIFPAPFIDISQANMLAKKYQRILVSCAGIAAELLIAGLALWLWQHTEPSLLRHVLLATWLTAGLSTLVFNANPLMKMDGYYALTDALELPNLAQRSAQYWQETLLRQRNLQAAPGESFWLTVYAPASWCWRASIFYWSFVWIGSVNRPIAFLVGIAAAFQLLAKPIWQLIKKSNASASNAVKKTKSQRRYAIAITTFFFAFLLLPLPDRSVERAIWTVDNQYLAKARADGFVPIDFDSKSTRFSLDDPSIALKLARLQSRAQALQSRQQQALQGDLSLAAQLGQEIELLNSETKLFLERKQELAVGEQSAIDWISPHNLPGQWVKKGQLLGIASAGKTANLQLVVNQSLAGRISTQPAQFFGVSNNRLIASTLERQTPMALEKLPNSGLSKTRGGSIETDPLDPQQLRPLHPSFRFDLQPLVSEPLNAQTKTHGTVTWVIVDFGYSVVAKQMLRGLQETIRTQFALRTV
jgi:putative peptide zinc metalloprotease protein